VKKTQSLLGATVTLLSFCSACSTNSKTNSGTGGGAGVASGSGGDTTTAAGAGGTANVGAGGTNTGGTNTGGTNTGGTNTGGTNTGGTNSGGTNASAGTGGTAVANVDQSVTQRGGDSARTAHWVHAALTTENVAKMAMDTDFKATFAGEMSAVPLFLAGTAAGKGIFFAATTQNDVYALDETTGATLWTTNIGAARTGGPGPGIKNRGIVSTPVIDATKRVLYVAAGMATGHHEIHALSIDDKGAEVTGWPVDVSKVTAGSVTFNSTDQNQRSALSLVDGILYVAFGGYYGDGGNYHGWVVSVKTSDPTEVAGWATLGAKEGIWAAGGLASDGNGVFAITGNGNASSRDKTDSEEVIRITGMSVPNRDDNNLFYPSIWSSGMDNGDLDFGSCSPTVFTVPDSTPGKLLVAPAKPGHVYFLDATKLGGGSGQLSDLVVASTEEESVYTAPSAYQSGKDAWLAISTQLGSVCPGGVSNGNVMGIHLQPGNPPTPEIKWCGTMNSNDDETRRRSPIATNSNDAGADPVVWFLSGSSLVAFKGDTGDAIPFTGGTCAGVHRFTSPISANGRIIVGGDGHLCSWSVH
jgi:hypothetical protein